MREKGRNKWDFLEKIHRFSFFQLGGFTILDLVFKNRVFQHQLTIVVLVVLTPT